MPANKYEVTERLFLDADGNLVDESDPKAATLLATPGKQIPLEQAKELGLVSERKQAAKPADKKRAPAKNKSRAKK